MAKTPKKAPAQPKAEAKPRKTATAKTNGSSNVTEMPRKVTHDQVANLAHQFWIERGRQHGHHEEDWHRAEEALRGKAS